MDRILLILIFLLTVLSARPSGAQSVETDSLAARLQWVEENEKIPILIELIERTQQDQPERALSYAAEAEKLLAIYPDPVLESFVQTRTGWTHYYLREFDTALEFAHRSEARARTASHPGGIARAKHLRGRLYRENGEYERSLAVLDSALVLTQDTDDLLLRASILNETGTIYRRTGDSGRALEYHSQALELIETTGNKQKLSNTLNLMGIIHDIIGNYDESLRFYLQSLRVREELGDLRGIAGSMTNIGTLHQKIGQYPEALDFFERSLPIWKELDAQHPLASTLNNIGTVQEGMGEYEVARTYYQEAYEIWSELGNLYSISIALNNLGAIYHYFGDFDRALALKKEALKNRIELGDNPGSSNVLNNIARIYIEIMQPDSAMSAAQQSLELAQETGSWTLIMYAHELLSEIHETSGDYERALEHHKLFQAASDTLFNSDSQTVIAELQEQYRTRQQQQQIELLQRERENQQLWFIILGGGFATILIISGFMVNRYKHNLRTHEQLHESEMQKARLYAQSVEARTKLLDAENRRKSKELEDARNLQLSMLPTALPACRNAHIAASMETAVEIGGDYYDVDQWEDGTLTVCIGDATGHGTKAGLLVMAMKSLFNLTSQEEDLTTIMHRCSAAIKKMNLSQLYMAFALARLKGRTLELTGGGMPPALIYRAKTGRVESIGLKGMPLGSVLGYPYIKTSVPFLENDVLLLLSDGYPELVNQDGEMMGYDSPAELLAKTGCLTPEEIIERFKETAAEWTQAKSPNDDMTFVVLKKNPLPLASTPCGDHKQISTA